ncbi:MAG: TonB family protein [Elusimicrobiota bacterium]
MNEALKPFLARSFGLHAVGAVVLLLAAQRGGLTSAQVYMIDFVGPSATIMSSGAPSAAKGAPAIAAAITAQADPDSFARKGRRGPIVLPRPSLLRGGKEEPVAPSMTAAPGTSPAQSAAGPGGPAGAGIATDLPNFPYPWYISQVRLMLWQAWQKKMPRLDAEGGVVFAILRNGSATDLRVESSSGDSGFDRSAMESVQAAAPFPALPSDFREPFLKIHLTLKSEEAWR